MRSELITRLKNQLDSLVSHVETHKEFINCHMVSYLLDNHWKTFIPQSIQNEIQNENDIDEAISYFWNQKAECGNSNKFKSLENWLRNNRSKDLENIRPHIFITTNELLTELDKLGCKSSSRDILNIKEFMNAKKNHEVEITASVIAKLCTYKCEQESDSRLVIDAGDGKGYLSSRLALEHKIRVLGIDGNSINTEGAMKRNRKLSKAWKGLTKRAASAKGEEFTDNKVASDSGIEEPLYKTTTQMIDSSTDLAGLVHQTFPNNSSATFCLSGLHSCGNLSPNSLNIFLNNEKVDVLCNVGCCYHLLVEQFVEDAFFNNSKLRENSKDFGFPISQHMKHKKFYLGRNARMLAAQSLDRVTTNQELPSEILAYRACFELILRQHLKSLNTGSGSVQVGRVKKCTNFPDYVHKCIAKLDIQFNGELPNLDEFYIQHEFDCKLLKLFYLLRLSFAGVIETIIVLDKYLYLLENGIENAFIVQLFSPVISPRCYGIVALK